MGLRSFLDGVLGRGDAAITVPIFDGALRPNQTLESADVVATLDSAEDLASDGRALFAACGNAVLRIDAGQSTLAASFDKPVSALALMPGGGLAVALDGAEIRIAGGAHDGRSWTTIESLPLRAVNALSVAGDGRILATDGSQAFGWTQWKHDLMSLGRTGRALALDPRSGEAKVIARNLAYAFGALDVQGDVWISESWRHRLVSPAAGGAAARLDRLPVYPSRLSPAAGGGAWLTAFAARTQLVEFVLREKGYRTRMMREIDPDHWIAPRLTSVENFLEPMQGAHLKTMGVLKPWGPPRSYGLVVRLDASGAPQFSFHSRVDGANHGIVAAVECGGFLYCLAKGPGRILRLPLAPAGAVA